MWLWEPLAELQGPMHSCPLPGTDKHVFSGVRPFVRRNLDWLWGVPAREPSAAERLESRTKAWHDARRGGAA